MALIPHQPKRAHFLAQPRAVPLQPSRDRPKSYDTRLAIRNPHDGPVADQGVVIAEQIRARPFRYPERMFAQPTMLHRRQNRDRRCRSSFLDRCMPKVERCNVFPGNRAPAVRETPIVLCEELGWAIEEEGFVAQLWIVEVRELEQKALH